MHNPWVVLILQLMYSIGQSLGCIAGQNGAFGLEDDTTLVVTLINQMYGDPALGIACSHYSLMNPHSVHALSAMFRQQSGVYVYNTIGKCPDNI